MGMEVSGYYNDTSLSVTQLLEGEHGHSADGAC